MFCFLGGKNLIRSCCRKRCKVEALCLQLLADGPIQILQKSAVHGEARVIRVDPDSERGRLSPVRIGNCLSVRNRRCIRIPGRSINRLGDRNCLRCRRPGRCAGRSFFAKRQLRQIRKEALIAAERDACCPCIFFQLPGHLLVLKVQERLVLRHNGVGQRHRVALHVISADVEEPHDLVQLAADVGRGILLRHFLTESFQLRLGGLARIFCRIQKENKVLRKRGAVLPGISCEVLLRRNLHLLLTEKSGERLTLRLGDAAAVKGKP